jgi:hypothetical protein
MLYYKNTNLRKEEEVYIGGRDVLYTRWDARSLAKPLTNYITRNGAVILLILGLTPY